MNVSQDVAVLREEAEQEIQDVNSKFNSLKSFMLGSLKMQTSEIIVNETADRGYMHSSGRYWAM